jgi:glycosyltransferase involved in cell wall biosynthesis
VLAVLAQLTPWKAQDDAVRAVHRLGEGGLDARLLLVGSAKFADSATRYDNPTYVRSLEGLIDRLGMGGRVSFLGEREDVPELLSAVDVVMVPSWEEPFGRAVAEAMAMGVPVAATSAGGPAELIDDGVEGLLLPPREPEAWSRALADLLPDRERRVRMGRAARERAAAQLAVEHHVEAVLDAYREAIGPRRRRPIPASAFW